MFTEEERQKISQQTMEATYRICQKQEEKSFNKARIKDSERAIEQCEALNFAAWQALKTIENGQPSTWTRESVKNSRETNKITMEEKQSYIEKLERIQKRLDREISDLQVELDDLNSRLASGS